MKGAFFPRGATPWEEVEWEGSMWRENQLALHLLKQAVNPALSMRGCLRQWPEIARGLSEGERVRKNQMIKLALS